MTTVNTDARAAITVGHHQCLPGKGNGADVLFTDRIDAARRLADALAPWRGRHPLVLAIPRGAVPMAAHIAKTLDGELDLVLVRKLPAPGNPEFAVGAVDESGAVFVAPHAAAVGADADWLARQQAQQQAELVRRRAQYTPGRGPIDPAGRQVIVVDDGLATGATMLAALRALRRRAPAWLVCAVPVASPDSLALVREEADEVVCLYAPSDFDAVGRYYRAFPQLDDRSVLAALQGAGAH